MILSRFVLLVFVMALGVVISTAIDREELATTREEILASRRRRSNQLEELIQDAEQRLADHISGVRLLSDSDRAALEKKLSIYNRKFETMRGDLDDREVERILKRDMLREERLKQRRAKEHSEF